VLVIAGPTASGKSSLALNIARQHNGTVINADSMQLYAELPILTAQPTAQEQALVPHRLYGVFQGGKKTSAGKWRSRALDAIAEAHRQDRLPIVVGGTGLYLRSLMQGLSPIPDVPEATRELASRVWDEMGPAHFRELLAQRDPVLVARLKPNDRQRHVRGYEVVLATGIPLSQWQKEPLDGPPPELKFSSIVLDPPRPVLRQRIEERFAGMVQAGALREVAALREQDRERSLPVWGALGTGALADHLHGKLDLNQAISHAVTATRQYAKRQITWLRHQIIADLVYNKQLSEQIPAEIFSFIRA
jgi:tRNA dimethylallyltransferase